MQTWKQIWENKNILLNNLDTTKHDEILNSLLKANGFDSNTSGFSINDYMLFIEKLFQESNLKDCKSVYEVGCGSGAFLYALNLIKAKYGGGGGNSLLDSKNLNNIKAFNKIGGIDYSNNLSKIADYVIKNTFIDSKVNIQTNEAINIESNETYDAVVSFSVFHYFPNLDYAKEVIYKMINKANKTILFLDILDLETKEEDIAYKKQICGKDYEKLYSSLTHLYYPKSMFIDIAKELDLNYQIQKQHINNYKNSNFRFNVIMNK